MVAATARLVCVDCVKQGNPLTRKATRPGPLCRSCRIARRKAVSEARWASGTLPKYKMTVETYKALYELQGGRCALCRRATGASKRLSVDHDHKCCPTTPTCGTCTRGLLCGPCNRLLGFARDAVEFFRRAIDYLENPPYQKLMRSVRRKR
jgi:recombination endonuclease VII